jgi:hypothetical protein
LNAHRTRNSAWQSIELSPAAPAIRPGATRIGALLAMRFGAVTGLAADGKGITAAGPDILNCVQLMARYKRESPVAETSCRKER